jgi:hypothetical protein
MAIVARSTGCSSTSVTLRPRWAPSIAAEAPATPPPTTTSSSLSTRSPRLSVESPSADGDSPTPAGAAHDSDCAPGDRPTRNVLSCHRSVTAAQRSRNRATVPDSRSLDRGYRASPETGAPAAAWVGQRPRWCLRSPHRLATGASLPQPARARGHEPTRRFARTLLTGSTPVKTGLARRISRASRAADIHDVTHRGPLAPTGPAALPLLRYNQRKIVHRYFHGERDGEIGRRRGRGAHG